MNVCETDNKVTKQGRRDQKNMQSRQKVSWNRSYSILPLQSFEIPKHPSWSWVVFNFFAKVDGGILKDGQVQSGREYVFIQTLLRARSFRPSGPYCLSSFKLLDCLVTSSVLFQSLWHPDWYPLLPCAPNRIRMRVQADERKCQQKLQISWESLPEPSRLGMQRMGL